MRLNPKKKGLLGGSRLGRASVVDSLFPLFLPKNNFNRTKKKKCRVLGCVIIAVLLCARKNSVQIIIMVVTTERSDKERAKLVPGGEHRPGPKNQASFCALYILTRDFGLQKSKKRTIVLAF